MKSNSDNCNQFESNSADVIIVGAGISGLAAAQVLQSNGLTCILIEARSRTGGRIHSINLPGDADNNNSPIVVDLGANYIHGCVSQQSSQPLIKLAQVLEMEASITIGDLLEAYRGWENSEFAIWRDLKPEVSTRIRTSARKVASQKQNIIDPELVADMVFLLDRVIITLLAFNKRDADAQIQPRSFNEQYERALEHSLKLLFKTGKRSNLHLNITEKGILNSLRAKSLCYVRQGIDLPSHYPCGREYERDAAQGLADCPNYPQPLCRKRYSDNMKSRSERFRQLLASGTLIETGAEIKIRSPGEDRLILSGFQQITDCLSQHLDIRLNHVVNQINWSSDFIAECVSEPPDLGEPLSSSTLVESLPVNASELNLSSSVQPLLVADEDFSQEPSVRLLSELDEVYPVTVEALDLSEGANRRTVRFHAHYCLITLPVGVLAGLHDLSAVTFKPSLPVEKVQAIQRLAPSNLYQSTHNKLLLRFKYPQDVFWDSDWPQLNASDPHVHILNLQPYGKPGVLLAHLWADADWPLRDLDDESLVDKLMNYLNLMYPEQANLRPDCKLPRPIQYHVTRWCQDPFSLASYTEGGLQSNGDSDRSLYRSSLPSETHPQLLFAGEATVLKQEVGQQCTNGAFISGVNRACQILRHFIDYCRVPRQSIIDFLLRQNCLVSNSDIDSDSKKPWIPGLPPNLQSTDWRRHQFQCNFNISRENAIKRRQNRLKTISGIMTRRLRSSQRANSSYCPVQAEEELSPPSLVSACDELTNNNSDSAEKPSPHSVPITGNMNFCFPISPNHFEPELRNTPPSSRTSITRTTSLTDSSSGASSPASEITQACSFLKSNSSFKNQSKPITQTPHRSLIEPLKLPKKAILEWDSKNFTPTFKKRRYSKCNF